MNAIGYLRLLVLSIPMLGGWEPNAFAQAPAAGVSASIAVRFYPMTPVSSTYETRMLPLVDERLHLSRDSHLRVIVGKDQPDPAIAARLCDVIRVIRPSGEWRLPRPSQIPTPKPAWFADALGHPLPASGVRITLLLGSGFQPAVLADLDRAWMVPLGEVSNDNQNRPLLPMIDSQESQPYECDVWAILVSHPDYGTAMLRAFYPPEEGWIRLPLVMKGTEARRRALLGMVTDDSGKPVARAVVECISLHFPKWGSSSSGLVVSDETGSFALYPEKTSEDFRFGTLIPPGVSYRINVHPPASLGLGPHAGEFPNSEVAKIVLPAGNPIRRIAFETAEGALETPEQLGKIKVQCFPLEGNPAVEFGGEALNKGARLPCGTYRASYLDPRHPVVFSDFGIGPDSQSDITIKQMPRKIYRGQTLDATAARPLPGVFVFGLAGNAPYHEETELTDEDWTGLLTLPAKLDFSMPELKPLLQCYRPAWVARSDAEGFWEASDPADETTYNVVALYKGCVPMAWLPYNRDIDADGRIIIPDFKMYPAARVIFAPNPPSEGEPKWIIDRKQNPPWALDIGSLGEFRQRYRRLGSGRHEIEVPAGVRMSLGLQAGGHGDFGETTTSLFVAQPGEKLDLGTVDIPPKFLAAIQVVDETGKPVEGVALQIMSSGQPIGAHHLSDNNGLVLFPVPPATSVEIGAIDRTENGPEPRRRWVAVNVKANEDPPPIFTLKLPRDFIERVMKTDY